MEFSGSRPRVAPASPTSKTEPWAGPVLATSRMPTGRWTLGSRITVGLSLSGYGALGASAAGGTSGWSDLVAELLKASWTVGRSTKRVTALESGIGAGAGGATGCAATG